MFFPTQDTFFSVKSSVLKLIEANKSREVTRATAHKNGGIYLLYVDDFSDERILPFYIGQTVNFQKRHQQHLQQILSLNRLHKECYEYALTKGLYNGNYRACKIFSYMLHHHCTLDQLHMVILEEIEDETTRTAQENAYISELFAPFLGFNQMACISQYRTYISEPLPQEYIQQIHTDAERLTAFSEYGYCAFYWHLIYNPAWVKKGVLPPPEQWGESQKNITNLLRRKNKIQSERTALLTSSPSPSDHDTQEKLSQLNNEYFSLCFSIHTQLAPHLNYKSHPLKSHTLSLPPFPTTPKENTCYINIEYTCMKADSEKNIYPEICKIDYLVSKNGIRHTRSAFIASSLTAYWENDDMYYCEKGFSYGPYQVFLLNAPSTHISVSVEYKTGINEYALSQFPAEDAADIFAEITAHIDDTTKIVYTSSGYKSCIKQYSHLATAKKRKIVSRLIHLCK